MRRLGAWVLVAVVLVAGCASPDGLEAGPDREVVALLDVEEALADAGGVSYRYTGPPDEYDGREVVVEGRRDVTRGLSQETRVTTVTAPAAPGDVDEHPTRYESTRETVTSDDMLWARALPAGERPGPWGLVWDELDMPEGDAFDPAGPGMASVVRRAGTVERFAFVSTEATTSGDLARRFRGTGTEEAEGLAIDVWIDLEGRLHRVSTSDGELLDLWDHGRAVAVSVPRSFDEDGSAAAFGDDLYPVVTEDWVVEAEGTIGERAWQVVRAPGVQAGVEVPCRMLLAEDLEGLEGWDDALMIADEEGPLCGRGGDGLLDAAVADPALQVLVPMSAWMASADVPEPLGLAVSPRFAGSPAVIVGLGGERIEVPLDEAGLGVIPLPGDLAVGAIELDGGSVVCSPVDQGLVLEDVIHAIELLWRTQLSCTRG